MTTLIRSIVSNDDKAKYFQVIVTDNFVPVGTWRDYLKDNPNFTRDLYEAHHIHGLAPPYKYGIVEVLYSTGKTAKFDSESELP